MLEELAAPPPDKHTAVAIGVFDGVHLGHQALFRSTIAQAQARGLDSAVVTFRNHPLTVLSPTFQPRYLMDLPTRLEAISSFGIDHTVAINFTREVSQLRAGEFVQRLSEGLNMKALICGQDFALGKNREGDLETLTKLGKDYGYEVVCQDVIQDGDLTVSSTAIRKALAEGNVELAMRLMSRPFRLSGPVVVGDKRGRLLGFPTANVDVPPDRALLADGIYATRALVKDRILDSITYIGNKPTFDGEKRATEVYIFDFDEDIYGHSIDVDFLAQIRGDMRFSGVQELIDQMNIDVQMARNALSSSLS